MRAEPFRIHCVALSGATLERPVKLRKTPSIFALLPHFMRYTNRYTRYQISAARTRQLERTLMSEKFFITKTGRMSLIKTLPIVRHTLILRNGLLFLCGLSVIFHYKAAGVSALMGMAGAGMSGPLPRRRKAEVMTPARDAEEEISAALQQGRIFRQISDTLPDLLYIYDLTEQRNIYVNREVGAMLGYTPEEIRDMGSTLFTRLIHPDDFEGVAAQTEKIFALKDGEAQETEYRMRRRDGAWRWLLSRDSVFARDENGRPTQTLGIAQDITERKIAQEAIQWQAALLRHTTDAATLGFYVADSAADAVLYYNTRFLELWNLAELSSRLQCGEITHTKLMAHCLPQIESAGGQTALWEPAQNATGRGADEDEIRLSGGRVLRRCATEIRSDAIACFGRFYLFEDITAQRVLEDQLETQLAHIQDTNAQLEMQAQMLNQANAQLDRLARTDGLTGLQNNRAFRDFLGNALAQSERSGAALSLILFDVDRFKQYNDAFGHPAGDGVLKKVAQILQSLTRETDCAARYGGEEFILVLPETGGDGANQLAERLRAALEGQDWPHRAVTASFGVATRRKGEGDAAALIAAADRAMYEAKHRGRNQAVHASALPPERVEIALAA